MDNALGNYQWPVPTWERLQQQYALQNVRAIPVSVLLVRQSRQTLPVAQDSPLPALVTIGSALLYAFSDNETVKALALQTFGVGATAWLGQSLN